MRCSGKILVFFFNVTHQVPNPQKTTDFDLKLHMLVDVDRDSLVGIAARYELDGPGIEARWRRHFAYRPLSLL